MKKLAVVCAMLSMFATVSVFADDIRKGDVFIKPGIGFGLYGIYGSTILPPLSLTVEYAATPDIGIGGIIGFATSSDSYSWGKYSYTYFIIGVRGEVHVGRILKTGKLDPYAGLVLGYNIASNSYVPVPPYNNSYYYPVGGSYPLLAFHVGANYAITPRVGIFGELGWGLGYLTLGASFKL